jgi:hypothetical protein
MVFLTIDTNSPAEKGSMCEDHNSRGMDHHNANPYTTTTPVQISIIVVVTAASLNSVLMIMTI